MRAHDGRYMHHVTATDRLEGTHDYIMLKSTSTHFVESDAADGGVIQMGRSRSDSPSVAHKSL